MLLMKEEELSMGDALPLDLSDDLLRAIGTVSAQWSSLEYYMARTTHMIQKRYANAALVLSKSAPFKERRNAFAAAFMLPNVPPQDQQIGTELAGRIEAAEGKRHVLIHGMASEDTDDDGGQLPPDYDSVLIIRDHPKHYFAERMSMTQIWDIVDEIAYINGDLFKLYLRAAAPTHGP